MRYDIEINITDVLTDAGKKKVTDMLFSDTSSVAPINFNTEIVPSYSPIDMTRYKLKNDISVLSNIDPSRYISRVENDYDFSVNKILIKHNKLIPFFNPGRAYFYNYPVDFSYTSTKKNIKFINYATKNQPVCCGYSIQIPDNTKYSSIQITTTKLYKNGIPYINRDYKFVDSNIVSIAYIYDELPLNYYKNNIIVFLKNGEVEGIYSTLKNEHIINEFRKDVIVVGDIRDAHTLLNNNGMALVDIPNNVIITRKDNKLYNFKHKSLFSLSKEENQFLIDINPIDKNKYVFLNSKRITYTQNFYERDITYNSNYNTGRYIYFNSYPLEDVSISLFNNQLLENRTVGVYDIDGNRNDLNYFEDYMKIIVNNNGLSLINTGLAKDINNNPLSLYIAGTIHATIMPTISYSLENSYSNNSRHLLYDLSSSNTNFTNGTLCLSSNELLSTTVGTNIIFSYPDGKTIPFLSSIRVIAKLVNDAGMPVPNKLLNISVNNNPENSSIELKTANNISDNTATLRTNVVGEVDINLVNTLDKNIFFVQKQWAGDAQYINGDFVSTSNKRITLPYKLNTRSNENIFLYIITADDPLIAQLEDKSINNMYINDYVRPEPYEYYNNYNSLESYYIEGRRIAYVSLQASENIQGSEYKLRSKFIKPFMVAYNEDDTEMYIKDAFIYNVNIDKYGKDNIQDLHTLVSYDLSNSHENYTIVPNEKMNILNSTSNKFNHNWQINDGAFTYQKIVAHGTTEILFENIPGLNDDNVIGYMIRTIPDQKSINISASYYDGNFDTTINKDSDQIEYSVMYANESELVISSEINNLNSYIGPYSYLTITEYLNSSIESNCTTYICKYSSNVNDGNGNRCIRNQYKEYYTKNDNSNLFCKHNIEYDLSIDPQLRCPGLDQQLINPFLLYTE